MVANSSILVYFVECMEIRNGLVVPMADMVHPMTTIFHAHALFEGFRHILIASKSSPHKYYVWTQEQIQVEWDWTDLDSKEELEDRLSLFMSQCISNYPMVKRHEFIKSFYRLLIQSHINYQVQCPDPSETDLQA